MWNNTRLYPGVAKWFFTFLSVATLVISSASADEYFWFAKAKGNYTIEWIDFADGTRWNGHGHAAMALAQGATNRGQQQLWLKRVSIRP